jgi:hypothetical protein
MESGTGITFLASGVCLAIAIAFVLFKHKHHAEDVVAVVINNYFF